MLTKYYQYGTGQSYIAIPVKLARELDLNHLDELNVEVREIDGVKGFIIKPIPKPKK